MGTLVFIMLTVPSTLDIFPIGGHSRMLTRIKSGRKGRGLVSRSQVGNGANDHRAAAVAISKLMPIVLSSSWRRIRSMKDPSKPLRGGLARKGERVPMTTILTPTLMLEINSGASIQRRRRSQDDY